MMIVCIKKLKKYWVVKKYHSVFFVDINYVKEKNKPKINIYKK